MSLGIDFLGDGVSNVSLYQSYGSDKTIVDAARISFNNFKQGEFDERDRKLLKYLLKNGHWSCFEHSGVTLRITAPKYIIVQTMRHQSNKFNEVSGRYVELDETRFYIPSEFRSQSKDNKQASEEDVIGKIDQGKAKEVYLNAVENSFKAYRELVDMGIAKEQARGLIPMCFYTDIYMTGNLRSMIHFLQQRIHPHAQWEIQQMGKAILSLLEPIFPETFAAAKEHYGF